MPDLSEVGVTPPIVKLSRPSLREFTRTAKSQIDDRVTRVTEPEVTLTEAQLLKLSAEATDKEDFAAKAISTVDWGEFDVDKLIDVMVALRKAITGIDLHPGYQMPFERRVYRSALMNDGDELSLLISRQGGKSETLACIIPTLCLVLPALAAVFSQLDVYAKGVFVGIYAPSGEQASTLYSRVLGRSNSAAAEEIMADPDFNVFPIANTRWSNGSFVFHQSADPRSKVESKTYHILIMEESVVGSTLLETPRGFTPISRARVGQKVFTYDAAGNKILDTVSLVWKRDKKVVYTLTLSDGTRLRCTGKTRILTDGGWKYAENLAESLTRRTAYCYINHANAPTYFRYAFGGWLLRLWRQRVFSLPSVVHRSLYYAKRVCGLEVLDTRATCFNAPEEGSQSWKRGIHLQVLYALLRGVSRVSRYVLFKRWKETGDGGVDGFYTRRRFGVLVHGRRWIERKRQSLTFPHRKLLTTGARASGHDVCTLWHFGPYSAGGELLCHRTSGPFAEYFLRVNQTVCHPLNAVQAVQLHIADTLRCLWDRVYSFQKNCDLLLHRLREETPKNPRPLPVSPRNKPLEGARLARGSSESGARYREQQIISVKKEPRKQVVYDIETEATHTFLANNILIHNCQGLQYRTIEKSLIPMVASTNGTIILVGTAVDYKCYFHDAITRNKVEDIRNPEHRKHYEYDYIEVQKYNPRYAAHVSKMIKRYGIASPYFQMSYCNKFLLEEGMAVTERDFKANMMLSSYGITRRSDRPVTIGIDQARKRNKTIVTVAELTQTTLDFEDGVVPETRHSNRVIAWLELDKVAWSMQRKLIAQFLTGFSDIRMIAFDSTGPGDANYESFVEEYPDWPTMPVIFSAVSKEHMKDVFYEYYWSKRLQIPTDKRARQSKEWQAFWLEWVNVEKVTVNNRTYFRKNDKVGASDDYVDSLLLMLMATEEYMKSGHDGTEVAANLIFKSQLSPETSPSFAALRARHRNGGSATISGMRDARHSKLHKGMIA